MLPGPQLPAHTASPPVSWGLCRGGERGALLMVHVDPLQRAAAPYGVAEGVEAVAHQPVDTRHTRLDQHFHKIICYGAAHWPCLSLGSAPHLPSPAGWVWRRRHVFHREG
ncbi:hypothetical protein GCM10020219_091290 [Nonomuraea dietziae]